MIALFTFLQVEFSASCIICSSYTHETKMYCKLTKNVEDGFISGEKNVFTYNNKYSCQKAIGKVVKYDSFVYIEAKSIKMT